MSSLYTTDALAHPYSSDSENDGTYTLNTPRGKGYTKHKGLEAPAQVSRIRTSIHPIRQPLSSTMSGNTDPTPAVSTSSRLKRLSLIGGPSSYTPRDDMSPGSPVAGPSTPRRSVGMRSSISYSPALSGTGTGHAQAGHVRAEQNRGSIELATPRSSLRTSFEAHQALKAGTDSGRSGEGVAKEERITRKKGETLLEQHGELLTMIAAKERRVNELKEELAAQEASLAQLKSRWTSLVSANPLTRPHSQAPHHTTRIRPTAQSGSTSASSTSTRGTHRSIQSISLSSSTSSDLSSLSTDSTSTSSRSEHLLAPPLPSLDQSIVQLLSNIPLPTEKIYANEAIEGGKRFWGQLVKTVSAAAVGSVPEDPKMSTPSDESLEGQASMNSERDYRAALDPAGASFDMSSLKGLVSASLPWTSPSPDTQSRPEDRKSRAKQASPPLPANASRLPRRPHSTSPPEAGTSTCLPESGAGPLSREDLLSDGEESMGGKALTPQKPTLARMTSESQNSLKSSASGEAEDGWGW